MDKLPPTMPFTLFFMLLVLSMSFSCQQSKSGPTRSEEFKPQQDHRKTTNPLADYVYTPDDAFEYEISHQEKKDGYTLYVIRMVSQEWLTRDEVTDPVWWHWVTMVVPDGEIPETGLVYIGSGNRNKEMPTEATDRILQIAQHTNTVAIEIHNIPNQPTVFLDDDYGPRKEDELIAFGWRKFMEAGGGEENAEWMARLPMTKAVVRAMDVVTDITMKEDHPTTVDKFVVTGGSKRGWTAWTTGAVDQRVVAIAPIVIDLLNMVPSFMHHWQAYGRWADAIYDYNHEGIMDWIDSKEFESMASMTEPYTFIDHLQLPKLILNAAGDQFFLPDSWQFYWDDLKGEKHLRYIPNTDHSMRESDVHETLISFYQMILAGQERPDFEWRVEDGVTYIKTDADFPPAAIHLWKATNPTARNFQLQEIGKAYESTPIPLEENGEYVISIDEPAEGWSAYFVELTFPGVGPIPIKLTTGTVVVPDVYPYEPFESQSPKGTK